MHILDMSKQQDQTIFTWDLVETKLRACYCHVASDCPYSMSYLAHHLPTLVDDEQPACSNQRIVGPFMPLSFLCQRAATKPKHVSFLRSSYPKYVSTMGKWHIFHERVLTRKLDQYPTSLSSSKSFRSGSLTSPPYPFRRTHPLGLATESSVKSRSS